MSEGVRTFKANAVLLHLDSSFFDFSEAGFQIAESPVDILSDDGRVVGRADVFLNPELRRIDATLFLDYSTPERFEIEVGCLKLFARANGDAYLPASMAVDVYTDIAARPRVQRVFIENLILTTTPPADVRIEPLKWEPKE